MNVRVDPQALKITYTAYDAPLTVGHYMGKPILHDGRLRVDWESPAGPYALIRSVRREPHPDDIETMRPFLAKDIAEAYAEDAGVAS